LKALRSAGRMVSLLAITGIKFVLLPISFIATMSKVFKLGRGIETPFRTKKKKKQQKNLQGKGYTSVLRVQ